jgi:predicted GNAT family N-acyltransferase
MKDITFKIIAYGSSEYKEAVTLRENILRKPLGTIFTQEELAQEKDHIHVAGLLNDKIVATAVLVPEKNCYKMQRVAVDLTLQSTGIGSKLMQFCEQYACERGIKEIYCSARSTAIPFYLKNGYKLEGEPYDEDGIPHQKMRKNLAYTHLTD